jgi:hypothetical protein
MGGPPAAPSNTQQQTTSVMDPKLYALLYGSPNAPGSTLLSNAARRETMLDKAQQGDEESMAKVFGNKDYKQYFPAPQIPTAQLPYQTSTPAQVAQANAPAASSSPTPYNSALSKDLFASANQAGTANQAQQAQGLAEGGEVKGYALGDFINRQGGPATTQATGAPTTTTAPQPYSTAQALFNGYNQYYDPKSGLSTNPYFQKGVGVLEGMQMPGQYQQASDLYGGAAKGLMGMSNYAPGQIRSQDVQGASMQGPQAWNTQQANTYMNPYMETSLQAQNNLSNRQFNNTMQGLRSQQAGAGAFGGARGAIQEQQAQQGQNLNLQNMNAQGMNQAYGTGLGAFQNQQQMQQGANQANAGFQQQANLANQQANLTAQTQNQQAGLQANTANQGALSAAGGLGAGMVNAGQAQSAFGNQQAQNWGTAATALQNVGQQYYDTQQKNATNWMNAVPTAGAPAAALVSGQQWGGGSSSNTAGKPSTMKKGGVVKRWNGK